MEKRIEYYCKKIDKAIKDNNKSDADMYYKKALKNVGDNEEILAFKSSIENIKVKTTVDEISTQENSKTLKSNEGLITLIAVLVAAAVLIIYCCTSIFPKYSLYRKLNHTWYVGDVSTSHSDGLALEFKFDDNYTFELSYRFWKDSNYFAIYTFSGQILNGNEISLDGQTIKVNFEENGEIVAFSPSFIGLGDKSTWKMYDIGIGGNEYFEGADFASSTTASNSKKDDSDKKEENISCGNDHVWEDITETVYHDEVGHYEDIIVDYISIEKYHCAGSNCEDTPWYYSYNDLSNHYQSVHGYTMSRDQMIQMCYTSYDQKPVYDKEWIVDKEAYSEQIVKGKKCSVCDKIKE